MKQKGGKKGKRKKTRFASKDELKVGSFLVRPSHTHTRVHTLNASPPSAMRRQRASHEARTACTPTKRGARAMNGSETPCKRADMSKKASKANKTQQQKKSKPSKEGKRHTQHQDCPRLPCRVLLHIQQFFTYSHTIHFFRPPFSFSIPSPLDPAGPFFTSTLSPCGLSCPHQLRGGKWEK